MLTTNVINAFIFISIILPSGSIFGINVKILMLLIVLACMAFYSKGRTLVRMIILLIPVMIFLLLESVYAYINIDNSEFALAQSKDILVFFLLPAILFSVYKTDEQRKKIVNIIISSLVFVGFLKILMLLFAFLSGNSVSTVVKMVGDIFGTAIMSIDIEGSALGRINFTSDAILPISLFVLMYRILNGQKEKSDYIKLILLSFSLLIGMSRYNWATAAIYITFAFISSLNKSRSFIIIASIIFFGIGASTTPAVQKMIESRLSAQNNDFSDGARELQLQKITSEIELSPMFGHGIGYYIPSWIRSDDAKYSYELQVPALVMQIGFFGVFILFSLIYIPILLLIKKTKPLFILLFSIMSCIWIASGFFNPVLFSSSGGVVYSFVLLLCSMQLYKRRVKL